MRQVIEEAQAAGVDSDVLQNHAARKDWEGLKMATARMRRFRREEAFATQTAVQPLTATETEIRLRAVEAELREAKATITDYDRQLAELSAELDAQQNRLRQQMAPAATGVAGNTLPQPGN